ncbi:helix-turn-helix domain-containing protein [Asticcacaulis benevestitus]|uniref:helix-turn-helix domain-containing protein n=1 Tax=Asticcacaulis benevestitus TaxID=347481 RepID=UPI003CC7FC59
MEAAIACVLRHGFHGASMSETAKQAQMSVGIIYRHFENKEAIIEAIVALDRRAAHRRGRIPVTRRKWRARQVA